MLVIGYLYAQDGILLTIFNLGVFYFRNKDFANNIHLTLRECITR